MDNIQNEQVTVCMPVLNEIDIIESVVYEWEDALNKLGVKHIILIEEGGSKDGTSDLLTNLEKRISSLKVIYKEKPDGFGNAARRLLSMANTEWIFFTDSDGQYVADDFQLLWERRQNNDFVRGIKLGRQDPLVRRITSLIWNKSVKFLFELPVSDINAAFLLIRREKLHSILPKVRILPTMVLSEIIIRSVLANFKFEKDVYVMHRARKDGGSRATPYPKLIKVGFQQLRGLFILKEDYRIR